EIEKFDHLPPARVEGASAFVSIMEGCSKYCSYCVVPYTRGEEAGPEAGAALFDSYGLGDDAEFFAAATELFFERPRLLAARLPALADELARGTGSIRCAGQAAGAACQHLIPAEGAAPRRAAALVTRSRRRRAGAAQAAGSGRAPSPSAH
ncbi:MAG: zinc-dependent peptidase, partial [Burkholderiales bacterium]|nr:zinc-dependent peptidase [Burkholderiales bacterium]